MRRRREGCLIEERSSILSDDGDIVRGKVVDSPVMSRLSIANEVGPLKLVRRCCNSEVDKADAWNQMRASDM
jgi:hypothetical protein